MAARTPNTPSSSEEVIHNVLGMRHVYKAIPNQTGGKLLVFELTVPPGIGTPLHYHDTDEECFYILEGSLTLMGPDGAATARPGDVCDLPAGTVHGLRNDGRTPAKALVIATPGDEAFAFFTEIDAVTADGAPDPAEITAIAARHQLAILAPTQ